MNRRRSRNAHFFAGNWPVFLLVIIAGLAYVNACTDSLALDDATFAVHDRFSSLSLKDYGQFFSQDLWAVSGVDSGLYRPLLLASIALDSAVFGEWIPGYHLTNVLLHILATVLVYGLMRLVVRTVVTQKETQYAWAAFWAAALFAVHPVHAEVVNSIFNRSEILVTIGVVGGLWWFLKTWQSDPGKAWAGLAIIYFMILLCKESAVTLPALALGLLWAVNAHQGQLRMRQMVPVLWLLLPLAAYLLIRSMALGSLSGSNSVEDMEAGSLVFEASRIPQLVTVWLESLKMLVWPHPLQIFHSTSEIPFRVAGGLQLALLITGVFALRKKHPGLLLGLLFFYVALLPSSRLIGEPGMLPHVAERYLYLPSVGLSLFLALELGTLPVTFRYRTISIILSGLLLVLTGVTLNRNAEWSSPVRLAESDYAKDPLSGRVAETLVEALLGDRQYQRVEEICQDRANELDTNWFLSNSCGVAYFRLGQPERAERAFSQALSGDNEATVRFNLAAMRLQEGRKSEAAKQFELAIASEDKRFMQAFRRADMLIQLHPRDRTRLLEARDYLREALEWQPQFYPARRKLLDINLMLGIPP